MTRFGALLALLTAAAAQAAPPPHTDVQVPRAQDAQERPQRIVTLSPHLAELVCAAGACQRLVGVAEYSDFPESVAALPKIGDAFQVRVEPLLALRPDLVLWWDGGTAPEVAPRLRALGLRVESLAVSRLQQVPGALLQLGGWLDTGATAQAEAARFAARLNALRHRYAQVRRLRTFYLVDWNPVFTIGGRSPINDAIALCGGDNVFAGLTPIAAAINPEALIAEQPEVVIDGSRWAAGNATPPADERWQQQPWAALTAVRERQVYPVNASLLARATPRMLDGVAQLCAALDRARAATQRFHKTSPPAARASVRASTNSRSDSRLR